MRRKVRGTLQINEDVKRLFMLAKPLNVTSSSFLQSLVLLHARKVREEQEREQRYAALLVLAAPGRKENRQLIDRPTCLGRPPGAKDLRTRHRRTKRELARQR
jgi:hypothetical protein